MDDDKKKLWDRYNAIPTDDLISVHRGGRLPPTDAATVDEVLAFRGISKAARENLRNPATSTAVTLPVGDAFRIEVVLDLLASPVTRFAAQILDSLIAFVLALVTLYFAGRKPIAGIAWGLLVFMAYTLLSDALPRGQSIGKRIMKIAVVDEKTMQPCTILKSFIRNISLLFLNVFDWIFIFGPKRQRLGDIFAKTTVVNTERRM